MRTSMMAALAVALAFAAAAPAEAGFLPYTGQHARVMGSVYRAQQRNNAVINHVQSTIRAEQSRHY